MPISKTDAFAQTSVLPVVSEAQPSQPGHDRQWSLSPKINSAERLVLFVYINSRITQDEVLYIPARTKAERRSGCNIRKSANSSVTVCL
jgi:hypothetical protein